jgi:hypothetical protein
VLTNNGCYFFCCSNKSNLALLSCYGFFIPGNVNDAQLLKPMFSSCLAAAQGVQGFEERLIKEALSMLAASAAATDTDDATEADAGGNSRLCRQDSRALLRASHQRCAAAALPLAGSDAGGLQEEAGVEIERAACGVAVSNEPRKDPRKQLQLQRYLAELLLYQVQLVLRLLGTTTQEDELLLQQLRAVSAASAAAGGIIRDKDHLSLQQAVAARMDQKLLLLECQNLLKQLLAVLDRT